MVVKTMPRVQESNSEAINPENVSKEVLVIAQEIEIVKSLACNNLNKRNRQLKRLRKWLTLRTTSSFPFTEEDFRRIWKGLYYTMWMSDKPLVQEDLAEQLGKLLFCFNGNLNASTDFFGAFLFTMYQQWFGIDQWRIDKFMMLVRRMLRYMFRVLKDASWSSEGINLFNKHLTENVFTDKVGAAGLTMHILDIFCEELAKVADGDIDAAQVGQFIRPFVEFYCTQRDCKLTSHCRTRIFYHLMYQSSLGREYTDKYNAWKEMGFPTVSINDLEKVEENNGDDDEMLNEDETTEKIQQQLDPRAGKVDVYMPELPMDVTHIIDELTNFLNKHESNTKRRKQFIKLLDICKTFKSGEFPLGIKKMPRVKLEPKEEVIAEKLENLDEIENEVYGVGRKLKQLNKRKRRQLLKSLDLKDVDVENFDKVVEQAFPQNLLKERKRKANDKWMNSWIEDDIDEDLAPKKKKAKKVKPEKTTKEIGAVNKEDSTEKQLKRVEKISNHKKPMLKEKPLMENIPKLNKKKHLDTEKQKKEISKNDLTNQSNQASENQKKQKITSTEPAVANNTTQNSTKEEIKSNQWETPLEDGEIEYFIPSRKLKMKKANSELVLNPLAMKKKFSALAMMSPKTPPVIKASLKNSPKTPASVKRVKIALKHNTEQKPSEYIRQVKCSPNLPYDASKKPGKGLLKPHSVPSPINPFYKKKIGLRLWNDTM